MKSEKTPTRMIVRVEQAQKAEEVILSTVSGLTRVALRSKEPGIAEAARRIESRLRFDAAVRKQAEERRLARAQGRRQRQAKAVSRKDAVPAVTSSRSASQSQPGASQHQG